MGDFGNEFAVNLQQALIIFVVLAAPAFGYFFNQAIDKLKDEREHTSLYVAIGVFVTIVFAGLISWKAALMMLVLFGLTGLPMILGEFKRTAKKRKSPRRKRLPYAANGILDEARMAGEEMLKLTGKAVQGQPEKYLPQLQHFLTTLLLKLAELKNIQIHEK